MLGDIILWLTLALPLIIGVAFRVGTSHVFFSLMAGELLGRYFGHDVEKLFGSSAAAGYGEIIFIVLTMLVTAFLLRHTISKRRLLIQVVPLAITGIICAAFILPALPASLQEAVSGAAFGGTILNLNRAIVGGMVLVQLLALWLLHRRSPGQRRGALSA